MSADNEVFETCKKTKEEATVKFKAQEFSEAGKLYVEGADSARSLGDFVKPGSEHEKYIQICY